MKKIWIVFIISIVISSSVLAFSIKDFLSNFNFNMLPQKDKLTGLTYHQVSQVSQVCTENALRCNTGSECSGSPCVMKCQNNAWVEYSYCQESCSNGECVSGDSLGSNVRTGQTPGSNEDNDFGRAQVGQGQQNYCGDEVINNNEECDGNNLNEKSCTDFSYVGGDIYCDNNCEFSFSECISQPSTPTNLEVSNNKNKVTFSWDNVFRLNIQDDLSQTGQVQQCANNAVRCSTGTECSGSACVMQCQNGHWVESLYCSESCFNGECIVEENGNPSGDITGYAIKENNAMSNKKLVDEGNENYFNCDNRICTYSYKEDNENEYYYAVASRIDRFESSLSNINGPIKITLPQEPECTTDLQCQNIYHNSRATCTTEGICVISPEEQVYTLDINIEPLGIGSITKNPNKEFYDNMDSVKLTAIPLDETHKFKEWIMTGTINLNNPINIIMENNEVITARFEAINEEEEVPECTTDLQCQNIYHNSRATCTTEGICVISPEEPGVKNQRTIILNNREITIIGDDLIIDDASYSDNKYYLTLTSNGKKEVIIRGLENPRRVIADNLPIDWNYTNSSINLIIFFSTKTIILDYSLQEPEQPSEPGQPGSGGSSGGSGGSSGGGSSGGSSRSAENQIV